MDAQTKTIAQNCLTASYEATMDFPEIVGALIKAGFDGYLVDYRRSTTTYYLPDGDNVELPNVKTPGLVAAIFAAEVVEANVRQAQAKTPGYTYKGFCEKVKAAGCAGYLVSFLGKRVVYYGRTGETHVEHFPQ
ncbi:MAG: DUF1398 family protein [Rhizobiaceae bacterium]|nr:DUF1398 family protein [Rhizobiaceae bacterium]